VLVCAEHFKAVVLFIQIFVFQAPLGQLFRCCAKSKHVREPPDCADHTKTSDHLRQIKYGSHGQVTELFIVQLCTPEKLFKLIHSLREDSRPITILIPQAKSLVIILQREVEESERIENRNKECPDYSSHSNPDQTNIAYHHFSKERRVLN
jgi:hypothetical protein